MTRCAVCGDVFGPGDRIDLERVRIPAAARMFLPAARPYLGRLLVYRCPKDSCRGRITAVYLEPAGGAS